MIDVKGSKASKSLDACLPPVRKSYPGVKRNPRDWAAFEDATEREGFIGECFLFDVLILTWIHVALDVVAQFSRKLYATLFKPC